MAGLRLGTDRLVLRDWQVEDSDDFHRLHSDPKVMATLGEVRDMAYTKGLIADLQGRSRRNGGYTYWAIERRDNRRVIGFCGLVRGYEGPIVGELEIGWRLASDCWGQGYALEAARSALDWARLEFPSKRVVAITAAINERSRALMKKLGMRHLPTLDFDHGKVAVGSALRRHVVYEIYHG